METKKKVNRILNVMYEIDSKDKTYRNYSKKYRWNEILPMEIFERFMIKLETHPPSIPNFNNDTALYFMSLILSFYNYNKDENSNGFTNISYKKLVKINHNYKKYFNYLEEIGLIEINNKYSTVSNFSKSYKLILEDENRFEFGDFDLSGISNTAKKNIINSFTHEVVGLDYLTKWFDDKLTIDDDVIFELNDLINSENFKKENTTSQMMKIRSYLICFSKIRKGNFYFSRNSESDNRLHTNLTNIPRWFRKHIKYNGKPLVSIDIKNSQPYFAVLLGLLLDRIDKGELENNEVIEVYRCNMSQSLPQPLYSKGLQSELRTLFDWVQRGEFYENLIDILDLESYRIDDLGLYKRQFYNKHCTCKKFEYFDSDRDLVKRLTMFFLYKSNHAQNDVDYLCFKEAFPEFCNFIEVLKENDPKLFPKLLQHIEAKCVLDYTCKRIAEEHPDMPLWTIHDSILTTVDYEEELKALASKHITSFCNGYSPQLSMEYWR